MNNQIPPTPASTNRSAPDHGEFAGRGPAANQLVPLGDGQKTSKLSGVLVLGGQIVESAGCDDTGIHRIPKAEAIQQADAQFELDREELLSTHPGRFVAYYGRQKLGVIAEPHLARELARDAGIDDLKQIRVRWIDEYESPLEVTYSAEL